MSDALLAELTLGPPIEAGAHAAATASALARADREGLVEVALAHQDSPIGVLTLAATSAGLVRVGFPREHDTMADELAVELSPRVVELPKRLDRVRRQLDEYFAGRRRDFDLDVDLRLARGFRRTVLERLYEDVGYGQTRSYLELAAMAGSPRASRAVGSAMATNPVPIVVPCHRVLRTGGALGGYGGGLDVKRWLLALEGAGGQLPFDGSGGAQPSFEARSS
ncbi:MAG: methylated-DNA--[protein]-cysteine S-methyltransferase [Actinomycetota bacterium]|nr:methylated-DNA--[protein]-cysteine S-methyltransferase [Acidimicrobiia bacterium]MDQ3293357.1 methylated-DNA--[protein]-cysteine S-methyltransferase [Actinomycetota bacterium]